MKVLKNYQKGVVNPKALKECKQGTAAPLIRDHVALALREREFTKWNNKNFQENFRSSPSRERLDEVVATFLLSIMSQISNAKLYYTLHSPGSWSTLATKETIVKVVTFSTFSLLYKVKWEHEHWVQLDLAMMDIMKGEAAALRTFAARLGVTFSSREYFAEKSFTDLHAHTAPLFGPYYWRFFHWIAEALPLSDNRLAKKYWREFATESYHRFLRCGICIEHYRSILLTYKRKIMETPDDQFPRLWYEIHNLVNDIVHEGKRYSESEFQEDRLFMRSALQK